MTDLRRLPTMAANLAFFGIPIAFGHGALSREVVAPRH